jgi:hypothetical protein
MKISKKHLRTGLLALTGLALSLQPARAVNRVVYNSGDLLIGFTQKDPVAQTVNSTDLVVDLGQVSQYIPISLGGTWNGSTLTTTTGAINLGVIVTGQTGAGSAVLNLNADLTAVFGSSWNLNPTNNSGVTWGVAGYSTTDSTDYLTQDRPSSGVQSTPPGASFGNSAANGQLSAVAFGFNNAIQNSSVHSSKAVIQSIAGSNSWYTRLGNGSDFTGGYNILQTGTDGPTNSVQDLYRLSPDSGNNNVSTLLGSFSLDSSGVLSYYAAVPEPSTFAAIATGAAFLLMFRPRRQARA